VVAANRTTILTVLVTPRSCLTARPSSKRFEVLTLLMMGFYVQNWSRNAFPAKRPVIGGVSTTYKMFSMLSQALRILCGSSTQANDSSHHVCLLFRTLLIARRLRGQFGRRPQIRYYLRSHPCVRFLARERLHVSFSIRSETFLATPPVHHDRVLVCLFPLIPSTANPSIRIFFSDTR